LIKKQIAVEIVVIKLDKKGQKTPYSS